VQLQEKTQLASGERQVNAAQDMAAAAAVAAELGEPASDQLYLWGQQPRKTQQASVLAAQEVLLYIPAGGCQTAAARPAPAPAGRVGVVGVVVAAAVAGAHVVCLAIHLGSIVGQATAPPSPGSLSTSCHLCWPLPLPALLQLWLLLLLLLLLPPAYSW
jgi:hypothetical protein